MVFHPSDPITLLEISNANVRKEAQLATSQCRKDEHCHVNCAEMICWIFREMAKVWVLTEYFCSYYRTHILDFKWISCLDTSEEHVHYISISWIGHPAGNPRLGIRGSSGKLRWFPPRCFHNQNISRDAFELIQTSSSTYIHAFGAVANKSIRDNLRSEQTHLRDMRGNFNGLNAGPRCSESRFILLSLCNCRCLKESMFET